MEFVVFVIVVVLVVLFAIMFSVLSEMLMEIDNERRVEKTEEIEKQGLRIIDCNEYLENEGSSLIPKLIHRLKNLDKNGEDYVKRILDNVEGEHYILSDINVSDGEGVSKIGHILISLNCIAVIDMIDWTGVIEGIDGDEYWYESFKENGRNYVLNNPAKQNDRSVRRVKRILGDDVKVVGVVCFTNRNVRLSKVHSESVCKGYELRKFIQNNSTEEYTTEDIKEFYELVKSSIVEIMEV